MRKFTSIFVVFSVLGFFNTVFALPITEFVNMPVVVNIHKGSGITKEDAKKSIEEANKIFKQAGIKLTITKTNEVNEPGDADGKLTLAERDDVRKKGSEELPGGEGVKVVFTKQPDSTSAGTNGLAVHKNPTVILRKNPAGDAKTAQTVAHEISHILTLDDTYKDEDKTKLMYGYSTRTDTKLTAAEIKEIKGEAKKRANTQKKESKKGSSTAGDSQLGKAADPNSSASSTPVHSNVVYASMYADSSAATNYDFRLTLDGLVPLGETGVYRIAIDTDNNIATGGSVGSLSGIDRIIKVEVLSDGSTSGALYDGNGFFVESLAITSINEVEFIDDVTGPTPPVFEENQQVLELSVAKSSLALDENFSTFEVNILSGDVAAPDDDFNLLFDLYHDLQGPQISTNLGEVYGGDILGVTGTGYAAFELVDLFIDDFLFDTVQTDQFGDFYTDIDAPQYVPEYDYFFLTGLGQLSNEFGFAVVNVDEPNILMLFGIGGLLLMRRKLRY